MDRCRHVIPQTHAHIHNKMENMIAINEVWPREWPLDCVEPDLDKELIMSERARVLMMSSARRQTLEARLHHPDQVVGRHHMQHIGIEERDHLAQRTSNMREMPSQDFE